MLTNRKQTISLLASSMATGSLGSKTRVWTGTKTEVQATVQPLSSHNAVAQYGERSATMKQAFVPTDTTCGAWYGVWLAGETADDPPWIVSGEPLVYATHILLILEKRV